MKSGQRAQAVVLLCGESNPYSLDPEHALLPWPREAAGNRLRLILGMTDQQYLRAFVRRNLLMGTTRWSVVAARVAVHLLYQAHRPQVVICLGRRVADAWATAYGGAGPEPLCVAELRPSLEQERMRLVHVPHPSGRNRAWNVAGTVARARALVRDQLAAVGVVVPAAEGSESCT